MKNTVKILALVMLFAMALTTLAACELPEGIQQIIDQLGGTTTTPDADPTDPVTPVDPNATFTVKWVQGQKVLKEMSVKAGSTLTEWTPTVEGKEFKGWFSDPGLTKAFDFTTTVTADMKVYGSFKTTGAVDVVDPEPADYFLLGQGLGDLSSATWTHATAAKTAGMTDKGNGVYEIIITMYAGDKFQIGTGGGWGDGQWGIGCIAGYTMVDDTHAQVTNETGDVIFTGHEEFGNENTKWDIILSKGWDGRYKFTFDSNTYTITWDLLESIDPYEPGEIGDVADKVYLNPGDEWSSDGSMYGAWCWTSPNVGGQWVVPTDADGDGVWEFVIPDGCDMILFVDFKDGADVMDWSNARTQTSDMNVPSNSKVVYNAATNTWSEK